MYRILAIGTPCNVEKNIFTGQSTMFDGIVKFAKEDNNIVDVVDISTKLGFGKVGRIFDYIGILIHIVCKCIFSNYDIVYITTSQSKFGFYRDYAMIHICKFFHKKVITHQYGGNYKQMLKAMNSKDLGRLKKMIDYVSAIIVEGDYMKEQFAYFNGYKSKVIVIPNGLPIEGLNIGHSKMIEPNKPFRLFYLSNLIYSKGYFDVLKAVNLLVNKYHKNIECVFAGKFMPAADDKYSGISNKYDFDKYVRENNLTDNVEYYSGVYGAEKDINFLKSNVFVLPTYYINEGQPVSIIEAMAYGCVPIVTEYRHIPMMINNSNGCFVEAESPESICEVILQLLDNPNVYEKKSSQAITDYMEKFKFEIYALKVMNVIKTSCVS